MKRSKHKTNRKQKAGAPPIVGKCGDCGKEFPSKYQLKEHICRLQEVHRYG